MSKKSTKPMETKKKEFVDIYPTCIFADVVTAIYFAVTLYYYHTYGEAYGIKEVIFAVGLMVVAGILTGYGKNRRKKEENKML